MLTEKIYFVSKRFFGVPNFFNYAIADEVHDLRLGVKTGIRAIAKATRPGLQLCLSFWAECR
jgi:hypothetical protein